MELSLGIAKIKKYAVSESGDTLEFIERPGGGLSVVLVDGQRSGRGAKRISNKVAGKVVSLLSEGIRDGAAARAVSDYLYHERGGKVTATLNILSADLVTKTIVVTRNNPAPVYVAHGGEFKTLDDPSPAIGVRLHTRPVIYELPFEPGVTLLAYTDGVTHAGSRTGESLDVLAEFARLLAGDHSAQEIADAILGRAMALDHGRPVDDISVAVLKINLYEGDEIRRVSVSLPLGPLI
ncbi:MAG TPA: PP2C family protein-serine/threonine phosphatase [Anaerolineales bacterium]|nr:PP2C family protein-serine/threonine phosphatase [Anaerolineales bacterium]